VPLPAARPAPPSQCQPFDRRPTSRQRLRALVAHFRMIISISKPAPAASNFGGYARAYVSFKAAHFRAR
jgi:hypothetical protein